MSPLAAVALAREHGVATVAHVSCRDRNRLALRSQVVGAAALGCDGVLCLYGDPVPGVPRVRDYTTTRLLAEAKSWVEPYELALGCVVDPSAVDVESELALLGRKIAGGADFAQTQMVLEPGRLASFLERAAETGKLGDCRIHASVPVVRTRKLADILNRSLPFQLPRRVYSRIASGGGIDLAIETAIALAELPQVHALHVMAWGRRRRPARSPPPSGRPAAPRSSASPSAHRVGRSPPGAPHDQAAGCHLRMACRRRPASLREPASSDWAPGQRERRGPSRHHSRLRRHS